MSDDLFAKFDPIEANFEDLERQLSDPEIISNNKKYQEIIKKHSDIKESVTTYRYYKETCSAIDDATIMLDDPELKDIAKEELDINQLKKKELEDSLQLHLIPKDPDDHKNAIIEIRAGTGGDEAALFAEDLFSYGPIYLVLSPTRDSILITSAPKSASILVQ